jgi:hypothetical protein
MAGRTLNRRELRQQADQADRAGEAAGAAPPPKKARAAKAPAAPRVRKPRAAKAKPRLRARWGLFDGGMRQVAVFDYNQRAAAEARLADLLARNKGPHFLQVVKEPMPDPAPAAAPPG